MIFSGVYLQMEGKKTARGWVEKRRNQRKRKFNVDKEMFPEIMSSGTKFRWRRTFPLVCLKGKTVIKHSFRDFHNSNERSFACSLV